MPKSKPIRYDVPFVMFLLLAWVGFTGIVTLMFWRTSDRSWSAALPWFWLWVFTVLTPTTAALRVHRRLNDLVAISSDAPPHIVRELANMRWLFLMFGSMAGLAALSLLVARSGQP